MALKPDRNHAEVTDIRQHWSELDAQNTQEKGGMASLESQGSGVAMDAEENVVQYADNPSGVTAMGILLQDVNPPLSATRDFKNHSNLEVRPGEKVTLVRQGIVVTDLITGTPSAGDTAWLNVSGTVSPTQPGGAPVVGRFETSKDADGFARLSVQIP